MLNLTSVLYAQTTSFTYQGQLTAGGQPAISVFDLQFALFDALTGGVQQRVTLTREDVSVANSVFTVQLDFGAGTFPGAELEQRLAALEKRGQADRPDRSTQSACRRALR